jgi:ubiquilin
MELFIKTTNENRVRIVVEGDQTIEAVKGVIEAETSIPAGLQRLIFSGRVLKDGDTVVGSGLQEGSTLHVVKGVPRPGQGTTGGGAPTDMTATAAAPPPSSSSASSPGKQLCRSAGEGSNHAVLQIMQRVP